MEHKILIVIDMQNDFITGVLGTKEAQGIVPAVIEKMNGFRGQIFLTQDTHGGDYLSTQEGRNLPVAHCIKGTPGWELETGIAKICKERQLKVYQKPAFGSLALAQDLRRMHEQQPITEIEMAGLCTDICVVSNALLIKAVLPEVPVLVDASCCAGVTPKKHQAALDTMESCQVEIVTA